MLCTIGKYTSKQRQACFECFKCQHPMGLLFMASVHTWTINSLLSYVSSRLVIKSASWSGLEHYNLLCLCYNICRIYYQERTWWVPPNVSTPKWKWKHEMQRLRILPVGQSCVRLRGTVYPIKSLSIIICSCEFSTYYKTSVILQQTEVHPNTSSSSSNPFNPCGA